MDQPPSSSKDDAIKISEWKRTTPEINVGGASRSGMLPEARPMISSLQPSQRRMSLIQKSNSISGNLDAVPSRRIIHGAEIDENESPANSKALAPSSSLSYLKLPGNKAIDASAFPISTVATLESIRVGPMGLRTQASMGSHIVLHSQARSTARPELPHTVSKAIRRVNGIRRASIASKETNSSRSKGSGGHIPERVDDEVLMDAGADLSTEETESMISERDVEAKPVPYVAGKTYLQVWISTGVEAFNLWARLVLSNPSAREWVIFDYLVFLLDICYLLVVPFASAFFCDQDVSFKLHYLVLDCLLFLRVILNMHRPKMDAHGQLILDLASKRRYYFQHMYGWFELIGALPIDWIPILIAVSQGSVKASFSCTSPVYFYQNGTISNSWDPVLTLDSIRYMYSPDEIPSLLFVYSALRFSRLISTARTVSWLLKTSIPLTSSPVSRLVKNLTAAVYVSHINTCTWWMMQSSLNPHVRWSNLYYVAIDYRTHQLTSQSLRYIAIFFPCLRALFFVHREHTYTTVEYAYQCGELLLAAIVYGSVIGNLSAVIRLYDRQAALDKAEKNREMRRQFVLHFMIQKRFSVVLQKKVLDQLDFEWIHQRGMDMERMFSELPRSIVLEVCVHLYYALVSSVPLFEGANDMFKVAMCERIFVINVCRGFYLCKAGDAGHEMYFVRGGHVEILTKDESKVLTTLGPNSFFGEIALFQECKRTATARTTEDSELCVLRKKDFDEILVQHPSMIDLFRRTVAERQERDQKRQQEQNART